MPIDTAAALLEATVDELSRRAPAVIATAAHQLGDVKLALHFGDGSHAGLTAQHSRVTAIQEAPEDPDVDAYFDERMMNLLFDLELQPVDVLHEEQLDVRGERAETLAVWRTFAVLSQRASGLRAVQSLWRAFRDRRPELWGVAPERAPAVERALRDTGWMALDYLDHRYPEHADGALSPERGTLRAASRSLWDGAESESWWSAPGHRDADLMEIMAACRQRVAQEMLTVIPQREPAAELYDLMRSYPSRDGKGLRPTLIMATCAAFGGASEDAVRAATAIELFHNGFLVHDDISDGSTHRRNEPTMHTEFGEGLAVNAGDGLLLLAVDTVLANLPTLGLARTLALIHEVLHMCRETIEGQAIELGWIRDHKIPLTDDDYFHMCTKKTGWYTCISPCRIGAVCARETDPAVLDRFNEPFRLIGIAFQIQDDVLNLIGDEALYGKEPLGDLLEGKRTIMLIHLMRSVRGRERKRLLDMLSMARAEKSFADAEELLAAMQRAGSIEYAIALADRVAHEGVASFEHALAFLPDTEAKAVLRQIANYVTTRPL